MVEEKQPNKDNDTQASPDDQSQNQALESQVGDTQEQPADYSSASVDLANPNNSGPSSKDEGQFSKMEQTPVTPPPAVAAQAPPAEPNSNKKPLIIGLVALLFLLMVGGGIWWYIDSQDVDDVDDEVEVTEPEPEPEPEPIEADVDPLSTEDKTPTITGTISGFDEESDVMVMVDGEVYEPLVANGDWEAVVEQELAPGTYDVAVLAFDEAGNEQEVVAANAVTIQEPEPEPEPEEEEPEETPQAGPEEEELPEELAGTGAGN